MRVPEGFKASGVSSGIKPHGLDLALIVSDLPCKAVGLFTSNRVKAAPVLYSKRVLRRGEARAIVANSGCANACTGPEGLADAELMARLTERTLGLKRGEVLVASTGVIGRRLPLEKVREAMPRLVDGLSPEGFTKAAEAIMTTDTVPKISWAEIKTARITGTVLGIAKGAGMIRPDLSTMLCFLVTDVGMERERLIACLREAVSTSFNAITVDGEQSTNDTVFLLANGAKGELLKEEVSSFREALSRVTEELSKKIVSDAEGATTLAEVRVRGAKDDAQAKRAAMRVANSLLVKTALFGRDPNWGRIMAALGDAGIRLDPSRISIWINGLKVVANGRGSGVPEGMMRRAMASGEVRMEIELGLGEGKARVLTSDLSYEYVRINSEYTT